MLRGSPLAIRPIRYFRIVRAEVLVPLSAFLLERGVIPFDLVKLQLPPSSSHRLNLLVNIDIFMPNACNILYLPTIYIVPPASKMPTSRFFF